MVLLFIIAGLAPSLVWLSFFLREDLHPEPAGKIFSVFMGGILAALVVAALQISYRKYLLLLAPGLDGVFELAVFASLEEIFKFLAVYFFVSRSRAFDEPVDAMIYMITAAMGLAAVENIGLAVAPDTEQKITLLVFRFLGATLLHAVSSGWLGYYWAKALAKKQKIFASVLWGLVLASALHFAFNYLVWAMAGRAIIYTLALLIAAAFLLLFDFENIKKNDTIKGLG